jgi:hypothetical protein
MKQMRFGEPLLSDAVDVSEGHLLKEAEHAAEIDGNGIPPVMGILLSQS